MFDDRHVAQLAAPWFVTSLSPPVTDTLPASVAPHFAKTFPPPANFSLQSYPKNLDCPTDTLPLPSSVSQYPAPHPVPHVAASHVLSWAFSTAYFPLALTVTVVPHTDRSSAAVPPNPAFPRQSFPHHALSRVPSPDSFSVAPRLPLSGAGHAIVPSPMSFDGFAVSGGGALPWHVHDATATALTHTPPSGSQRSSVQALPSSQFLAAWAHPAAGAQLSSVQASPSSQFVERHGSAREHVVPPESSAYGRSGRKDGVGQDRGDWHPGMGVLQVPGEV